MNVSFFRARVAVGLALFVAAPFLQGCGGSGYKVAPVSGKITIGGKPAAGIAVSFQPDSKGGGGRPGPGSAAVTDAQGRYTLRVVQPEQDGAVVGRHVVRLQRVRKQDPKDDRTVPRQFLLPEKCRDGSITFTVPAEGTDSADFELTKL